MNKRIKYFLYFLLILIGIGSAISSIIIEVKYFDKDIIWLCLLGACWTIISLIIATVGLISIYNTYYAKERNQKKKVYLNNEGKRKTFRDKEKFIILEDLTHFLSVTIDTEKIYILNQDKTFSVLEVYMEFKSVFTREYDKSTKEFIIDKNTFHNIEEIINYLVNNQFVVNDNCICVIGYEYSTPYYLQKRIEEIKQNSF